MENSNGLVEIFIGENTKMMREMGMGRCTGSMVVDTKEHGLKGFNMVKE